MTKLFVIKTKSGSFYEVEETGTFKKKWRVFMKGKKLEVKSVMNSEPKKPRNIYDFLGRRPLLETAGYTTEVKAIYKLDKIASN